MKITRKEWLIIIISSFAIIGISIFPVLFAINAAPQGSVYTGLRAFTPGDTNVYFSYIEQVKQGSYLFQDLFTSENQKNILFNPWWLFVGLIGKLFRISNLWAFHIGRMLVIPIFCGVLYAFIARFIMEYKYRLIAFCIVVFGSGFGALLSPILENRKFASNGYYHWPPDLWVPEAFGWFTLYNSPHIIVSTICMMLFIMGLFAVAERRIRRYLSCIGLGLLGAFWFCFHPFHVVLIAMISAGLLIQSWLQNKKQYGKTIVQFIIIALFSSPGVIYHLWLLKFDALALNRAIQNNCLTPVWWLVLIGYGMMFIGACIGTFCIISKRHKPYYLLIIWFAAQAIAIYLPLNYQRRMIQGWYIPMGILFAIGIMNLIPVLRKLRIKKYVFQPVLALMLFAVLCCSSSVYLMAADVAIFQNPPKDIIYKSKFWEESMSWIKNNTPASSIFLSGSVDGNFIPGHAGRKVYIGHDVETIYYEDKLKKLNWFFENNRSTEERTAFLKQNNINYIFYGKEEKELGVLNSGFIENLATAYLNDEITIYALK